MIEGMLLAGLLAASAPVVPVRFAPALDRPYRYATTETRTDGDRRYRFAVERRVVFHHDVAGWTATVTIVSHATEAPPAMARLFEAAQSALAAHPVRYHLDEAGAVLGIDDEAGVCAAFGLGMAGAGAIPSPDLARRQVMLSSTIEVLIAGADAARTPGPPRPVRIAGRPIAGSAVDLVGTEQASRTMAGEVFLLTRATGDPQPGTHLALSVSRRIDPATGLVTEQDRIADSVRDGIASRTETYTQFILVS